MLAFWGGVFGLIGCRSLSLSIGLPTCFNKNKNNLFHIHNILYAIILFIFLNKTKHYQNVSLSTSCERKHTTLSQQTQNSHAKTDRIPISKRCNDVRIDSAFMVLLQISFTRHTFSQHEILWIKYNGNVMAHLPSKLCVPIRIIVYNFGNDLSGWNIML